jgi:hypothetical protein
VSLPVEPRAFTLVDPPVPAKPLSSFSEGAELPLLQPAREMATISIVLFMFASYLREQVVR